MNPDRKTDGLKGVSKARDKATIKRLQMYRNFKAKRDSSGKIIRPAPFQSKVPSGTVARVEPNRKWFGNIRVVSLKHLFLIQSLSHLVYLSFICYTGGSISPSKVPGRIGPGN
jgi:nuclear GTP-binding protein